MNPISEADAYRDGYRAGRADNLVGRRSDYSSTCFDSESEWQVWRTKGYRDGNECRPPLYAVPEWGTAS